MLNISLAKLLTVSRLTDRFSVSKFFILLAIFVFDKIAENMKKQKPGKFLRKVLF